jgi:hypothetical protein
MWFSIIFESTPYDGLFFKVTLFLWLVPMEKEKHCKDKEIWKGAL